MDRIVPPSTVAWSQHSPTQTVLPEFIATQRDFSRKMPILIPYFKTENHKNLSKFMHECNQL